MLGLGVGFNKLGGTANPMSSPSIIAINEQNIQFDGTNDWANANAISGSINKDTGTISVWVRPLADSATTSVVSIAADDNNMIEILYVGATQKFRGVYRGGGSQKTIDSGVVTEAEWVHIVLTWDTTADVVHIYNDYNQTTVSSLDTFSGTVARVYLGAKAESGGATDFFKGKMDEIAFLDSVLTPVQIQAVTLNKSIGFIGLATYPLLDHYYKIDTMPYFSPFTQGIVDIIGTIETTLENGAVRTITDLLPPP